MWVPKRPEPVKRGVGAVTTRLWIIWTGSHPKKQGPNPCSGRADSPGDKVRQEHKVSIWVSRRETVPRPGEGFTNEVGLCNRQCK